MPVHHHRAPPGNPDASLFFAPHAPDSAAGAGHGLSAPGGCFDSARPPGVAPRAWPDPGTERCSSAGPGRSAGTPAPPRGNARTSTSVRSRAAHQALALPLEPRMRAMASARARPSAHTLDLIKRRCNNLFTLVADTVGRASRQQLAGHRGCRARSLEQQCCSTAGLPARQAPTAQPSRLRGSSS